MRPPKPLVVRAGLSRTFGSLAGFAVVSLLSLGIYLLADAFAHPVDAQAAALIVAAFAMALAIVLIFFLFKSRRIPQMSQHQTLEDFLHLRADTASPAPPLGVHEDDLRKDLAYQRPLPASSAGNCREIKLF